MDSSILKYDGRQIIGSEIADKIKKILRVNEDDDTTVDLINDGQQLLVQLPFERS